MLKDLSSLSTAPQPGARAAPTHAHRGHTSGAQTLALAVLNPMSLINDSADELMQSLSGLVQERSLRERRVTADGAGGAQAAAAQAMGLGQGAEVAPAIKAMNQRLGLPSGLAAMGVTEDMFGKIIEGAMADHCHKTNPRIATAEDYAALLRQSM